MPPELSRGWRAGGGPATSIALARTVERTLRARDVVSPAGRRRATWRRIRPPESHTKMAEKKKKKKRSAAEMHRTVQDQVQALPFAVSHLEKEGKRTQAFIVKYLTGPVLRFINKLMNRSRYKGPEGQKRKQSEQMKRHLEQRQKAV